jgi:hypothetical protein
MNYETEIIDGRKAVVRHFFKPHEIQVGSRWARADGSRGYVTVEEIKVYPASDHEENHWYEIYYSWEENGVKKTWQKETFAFQCRYCLIVE